MFGNEEELKNSLPNSMRIALITTNNANPDLPLKLQERIMKEKNKQFEFTFVDNAKDLFKYKEKPKDEQKGLIDKNWINNLKNLIPSVIILYYELQVGNNKELDEKIIYSHLEEIRNYTKNSSIFVILIQKDMKENPYYFNFNDRQKPFYLKNFTQKDKFYTFPDEQIWKYNEFNEIAIKIFNFSFQYYKSHHRSYKEKRSQSASREIKIEYNIKLAVLSNIKTKKTNFEPSKYLEEAYELLIDKNFDFKTYKYASNPLNVINNFYEIRAAGDWIFYKNNNIFNKNSNINQQNAKNKNILINGIIDQIKKFERHIKCFSNINYYDNGNKDYFHFVEYFWLSLRYKHLLEYISENSIKIKINKELLMKWFMIIFREVYNIMKMIIFYNKYFNINEFKLSEIKFNNKTIDINIIEEEENIFYGKPPCYYYINSENDNKKEVIGFNEEIYIKKFLIKNQIKYEDLLNKFKKENIPHLSSFIFYFKTFISQSHNDNMNAIDIYLNLLKNIGLNNQNIFELDSIDFYNKLNQSYTQIKKFPKIHMNFIRQYINLINKKLKEDDTSDKNYYKKELLINLSILGNINKLTEDEENLFYQILNDTDLIIQEPIIVNLNYYTKNNTGIIKTNELSLNFIYEIKDINKHQKRKILDLIEYELKFNSSLSKEKIKFNSLKLYLEYSKVDNFTKKKKISQIIKQFNSDKLNKYELDKNSNINILYKYLIKNRQGKISLTKIEFTLCKKENIIYSIAIPYEIEKTIFLTGEEADIMKINYPNKQLLSGVNQLYKFSYSIQKKLIEHIKIIEYKHSILFQKADKNNLQKEIFGQKNEGPTPSPHPGSPSTPTPGGDTDEMEISPSIFYFDEKNEKLEEYKNNMFEYTYNEFESRLKDGKTDFDLLFKFYKEGSYIVKLDIKFMLLHQEVNANLEFKYSYNFYFKIISPLSMTSNISSNNYSLNNNKEKKQIKEYLTSTPIKMNLVYKNLLQEDIIIKDILITKKENNFQISTTLKEIIDSQDIEEIIKEQIFNISNSTIYTIPFDLEFNNSYNDSIGKCKLLWTTQSLKDYQKKIANEKNNFDDLNLINETEFELPDIYVKNIILKYNYQYEVKNNNVIHLYINIENNDTENKRLYIQIGNNDETAFIISGMTNWYINLKSKEIKKIFLKLYVIQNGEIKLPDVIIREVDYDGKENSKNNFYSEKIILN